MYQLGGILDRTAEERNGQWSSGSHAQQVEMQQACSSLSSFIINHYLD
jgi:hypothetical protein